MPSTAALAVDQRWRWLAQAQAGIIAARQFGQFGFTADKARQWIRSGRWQRVFPGIFATFTGPLPHLAMVWAAILTAGPEAAASHRTALWLFGVLHQPPSPIEILVAGHRRVRAPPGVVIRSSRTLDEKIHSVGSPPRVRLEEAVLDQADLVGLTEMLTLVFRVTQGRFTTAARLRAALGRRRRHRWRALLLEVLSDVDAGVASALELRYLRAVERAHDLPRGERNRPESLPTGASRSRYIDVRYRPWRVVAELDGREAHPDESRFRDMQRDNGLTVDGDSVLRYGWHDVAGHPCLAAAQVISALRRNGWTGQPRACGPACPVR